MRVWETWEELLLGSAVLRHGTRDWDAVSAELRDRNRILHPYSFTAKICQAKFQDLQERYCGCTEWYEELRKQRVAELKRELKKSEDSIGSLESKLENLKAEKGDGCKVDYGFSRTESLVPLGNSDGVNFSGEETSKDGLSAGRFTKETPTNCSLVCSTPTTVSVHEETETKPEIWDYSEDLTEIISGLQGWGLKKRRGKRKRMEGCVGENSAWGSSTYLFFGVPDKEESTGGCDLTVRSVDVDVLNDHSLLEETDYLMRIFNSILDAENSFVSGLGLDNQKKARYEKTIRRHMDFDTIRSRILDRSITSAKELYRDLLLHTNNALVFYPHHTCQYQSTLFLKDLIISRSDSGDNVAAALFAHPWSNTRVKPRSVRPCNRNVTEKVTDFRKSIAVENLSREDKKACDADSQVVAKRGVGRPRKVGGGIAQKRPETPAKGRKGVRRAS